MGDPQSQVLENGAEADRSSQRDSPIAPLIPFP